MMMTVCVSVLVVENDDEDDDDDSVYLCGMWRMMMMTVCISAGRGE